MIETLTQTILQHIVQYGLLDLLLVILGFGMAQYRQFTLPFALTMLLVRILQWWLKTHPQGKQLAKETTIDEDFQRIFGKHLEKYSHPSASKVDTEEKLPL